MLKTNVVRLREWKLSAIAWFLISLPGCSLIGDSSNDVKRLDNAGYDVTTGIFSTDPMTIKLDDQNLPAALKDATYDELVAWRTANTQINFDEILQLRSKNLTPADLTLWRGDVSDASYFYNRAYSPWLLIEYTNLNFSIRDALIWRNVGFSEPDFADQLSAKSAFEWRQAGFSPDLAREYANMNIAGEWIGPTEATALESAKSSKVNIDGWEILVLSDIKPDEIKQYQEFGLDPETAYAMLEANILPALMDDIKKNCRAFRWIDISADSPFDSKGTCYAYAGRVLQIIDQTTVLAEDGLGNTAKLSFSGSNAPANGTLIVARLIVGTGPYSYVAILGNRETIPSAKVLVL